MSDKQKLLGGFADDHNMRLDLQTENKRLTEALKIIDRNIKAGAVNLFWVRDFVLKTLKEKFRHPEAFCLMIYRCRECNQMEKVWNSRDGVTPFILTCPSCKEMTMEHIDWEKDEFLPDYMPPVGSRIFVNLTREKIEAFNRKRIEENWDTGEYPINLHFETKEEALVGLMQSFREGEEPDIVVVGEGIDWRKE